jgi:hypothetical protein
MQDTQERPFICDGSPLAARVFLVGFNPATRLEQPFWSFWDDATGFDRARFMTAYAQTRALRGVRPRLNAMVEALRPVVTLETNICALPTPRASELTKADRRTAIFRFLVETIRPRVLFLHSNEPIAYVRALMEEPDIDLPELVPVPCRVLGSPMHVCAAPGPLWRRRCADVAAVAGGWGALLPR